MKRIRIAVVGCGVAAQVRHLPALARLTDRFEVTVLCDIDARALSRASPWAPRAAQVTSLKELLSRPERFDAVLIATAGDHVTEVEAAAAAGKHMFIEKPLALTPLQAEPIVQRIHAAGVVCVVGYMKRHSAAVRRLLRLSDTSSGFRIARCDLVHPPEDYYLRLALGRTRESGAALLDFVQNEVTHGPGAVSIQRTLGTDATPTARAAYFFLATSFIHNINLLRAALGDLKVVNASFWDRGLAGQATLTSQHGVAIMTYVFVRQGRYTETMSLVAEDVRCEVSFPSPYLQHAPVGLRVEEVKGDDSLESHVEQIFHDDLFRLQLEAFHGQLARHDPDAIAAQDALADLELVASIARAGSGSEPHDVR